MLIIIIILVVESTDLDTSVTQLNEIISKISSSIGYSGILKNFVIQKEKEKLTIFPLGWYLESSKLFS